MGNDRVAWNDRSHILKVRACDLVRFGDAKSLGWVLGTRAGRKIVSGRKQRACVAGFLERASQSVGGFQQAKAKE